MPDNQKVMKVGLVIAAIVIVVRIALEQAGSPGMINNIFGVAWLYFILPILFALSARRGTGSNPYLILLRDVFLFALFTRVMVMISYMLAYVFKWKAPRFAQTMGGNVGGNVGAFEGLLIIPARNVIFWVIMAVIVGMAIGSITLLLTRKTPKLIR